jgi:dTDP-4-dehydrorhamnose 3,5-epimerase
LKTIQSFFEGKVQLFEHTGTTDLRGDFAKLWAAGWIENFSVGEVFLSSSKKGVIRGLHYLMHPATQKRAVFCVQGKIEDVAVDIRKGSPTYSKYIAVNLEGKSNRGIYLGEGFAHGFLAKEDSTVIYLANIPYDEKYDRGIRWNDPEIGIDWAIGDPILSRKDATLPFLKDAENNFVYNDGE